MILRFNFISDNIENNKEGWMIDNIRLYIGDIGGGINDNKTVQFNIYPNPLNESAIIELNEFHNEIELSLLNIKGQLIKQQTYLNSQSITLNRDNLKAGIYFMKIKTDNNLIGVRKLVIN